MSLSGFTYDFFISAGSLNVATVRVIRQELAWYRVFSSEESLKLNAGDTFFDVISDAINSSQYFILVVTPEGMESHWVRIEYQTFFNNCYVKDNQRKIFLLKGKGFKMDLVPLLLRNFQMADNVGQIILAAVQPVELPPTPAGNGGIAFRQQKKRSQKKIIAGLILLTLITTVVAWLLLRQPESEKQENMAIRENPVQVMQEEPTTPDYQVPEQKKDIPPVARVKILDNGDRFEGGLYAGRMHGEGILYFSAKRRVSELDMNKIFADSGDYLKGKWFEGELDFGTLYSAEGVEKMKIFIGH